MKISCLICPSLRLLLFIWYSPPISHITSATVPNVVATVTRDIVAPRPLLSLGCQAASQTHRSLEFWRQNDVTIIIPPK